MMNSTIHMKTIAFLLITLVSFPILCAANTKQELPKVVSFNAHIRPLMSNTCFTCHGPDEEDNESEFRIDSFDAATSSLPSNDQRVGIKPGDVTASEVYSRIMGTSEGEQMPPASFRHQLTDYDRRLIGRWIEQGAKYEQHWSYAPIARPELPKLNEQKNLASNPVDQFVLERLQAEGIEPSPLADRATLLRRLSLDLIGLPPTVEQVQAFTSDVSEGAYEKQVGQLLSSKHFGERMASFWLDLVRFSDTVGFHGDQNQRIYPYRDYVINAFNDNKPFDEFTREQLAGDLLSSNGKGPSDEQLTASGFLRLNMVTREGGAQPGEYLAKYKADRVRAIGTAWLGSTLACCECHNHKYDPFTIKDFYSMGAFFDDLRQWGVYSDYGYTPNADLKGFNNDYPFPPELHVPSESTMEEIRNLERLRDTTLLDSIGAKSLESDDSKNWLAKLNKTLAQHPSGWVPVELDNLPEESRQSLRVLDDNSVLVSGEGNSFEIPLTVAESMTYASLRVEVLPDASHGGNVGRSADGRFSLSLSAKLEDKSTQNKEVQVRPRYVRIELPGKDKILSLAEVEVYAETETGMTNVALKGKATQSSDYTDGGKAPLAVDGITDGVYRGSHSVTHTSGSSTDPWWEVDLGSKQRITKIVIWNRTDPAFSNRLNDYRVLCLGEDRQTLFIASPETPKPSIEIEVPEKASLTMADSVSFAWSEADRRTPSRFTSGKEPVVLDDTWQSGPMRWQLPSDETKLAHTAVFHFASPLTLTPEHRLNVTFKSADVGRVRLSLTPIGHAIAGQPTASQELIAALAVDVSERTESQNSMLVSAVHRSTVPFASQHESSRYYRDEILKLRSGLAMTMIAQSIPYDEIPVSRVRPRGNWQDESGELAPPEFPRFLPGSTRSSGERLTRLDLADWLTSPDNPLTARHFVNRTWKQFFGNGLSSKLDDLGNQGEWPSHPALLDWLASEFIRSGWDMKHIVRLIVTSRTYRQAAAVRPELMELDPYNRLLAQQSPRRLEAEIVRDNALAISGLLQASYIGGPSVFPYQPDGHYVNIQFPDRNYVNTSDFRQYRRGVYMHWQRSFLHPMLVNFDAPARDECTADRPQSNSPQQALTLLNDPVFVEASHAMAARVLKNNLDREFYDCLRFAFLTAISREPSDVESQALRELYERQLAYYSENTSEAEKLVAVGNSASKPTTSIASLAAWTQVCRVILNLHETITRF